MDASTQKLSVTLIHGSVKHKLDVTKFDESCDELIVLDVLESAKVLTGVPIHAQKLICKGKSLSDPHQTLKDAGVKAGCKVMMIGKKTNPEEETNIKMIADEEKKTRNSEKNQNEIISEVDGIEKGFLEDGLIRQACGQLLKRHAQCHEEFMKTLEKLDAMDIPEEQKSGRTKRKVLIQRLQLLLDKNDDIKLRIEEIKSKDKR